MVKSTRSDQFGTVESIDSTTNIDFQEKRIAPFDSAPPKTPIYEVRSRIDKNSKRSDQFGTVDCQSDRFDHKYRFSRKTNSAIRFSTSENPHIRGLVKNRQRFKKSTRSDQFGTVESIDSTTNIDFQEKRIAPFDSAPPKTPISEVWSRIDKDSKSRSKAISSALSNRSIRPQISIFKKNE